MNNHTASKRPTAGGGGGSGDLRQRRQQRHLPHIPHHPHHHHHVRFPAFEQEQQQRQQQQRPPEEDRPNDTYLLENHDADPLDQLWGLFTAFLAAICLGDCLLLLALLHYLVRPISFSIYQRCAHHWVVGCFLDAIALLLPNTSIHVTGDSDLPSPVGTTAVLVSNHLMDGDWWAMYMLGRCVGLRSSIKVFLRNEYLQIRPDKRKSNNDNNDNSSSSTSSNNHAQQQQQQQHSRSEVNSSNGNGNGAMTSHSGRSMSSSRSLRIDNNASNSSTAASPDLIWMAELLHRFLDFPLMTSEDYLWNRKQLYPWMQSYADQQSQANAGGGGGGGGTTSCSSPVHFLSFPEGWSLQRQQQQQQHQHNQEQEQHQQQQGVAAVTADDYAQSILRKSNEFAEREGRPRLEHLLLPRIRNFNAALENLRASSPVVYDVTLAYRGYNGSLPSSSMPLSLWSLWNSVRTKFPRELHVRIKRYSMDQVLQDRNWLDQMWLEKDRQLSYFAKYQHFPSPDHLRNASPSAAAAAEAGGPGNYYHGGGGGGSAGRAGRGGGAGQHGSAASAAVLHTRWFSLESSVLALGRFLLLPCTLPVLFVLSIPILWALFWIWLAHYLYKQLFPDDNDNLRRYGDHAMRGDASDNRGVDGKQTPGSVPSAGGTPSVPLTPFVSPSTTGWFTLPPNPEGSSSTNMDGGNHHPHRHPRHPS